MADRFYDKGLNSFARGEVAWKAGGDTIRAFLVDLYHAMSGSRLKCVRVDPVVGNGVTPP